jgi:hypothetical protein
MRKGAAHERGVQHLRELHIVDVFAPAGEHSAVLDTRNPLSYEPRHRSPLWMEGCPAASGTASAAIAWKSLRQQRTSISSFGRPYQSRSGTRDPPGEKRLRAAPRAPGKNDSSFLLDIPEVLPIADPDVT